MITLKEEPDITFFREEYTIQSGSKNHKWWAHSDILDCDEELTTLSALFGLAPRTVSGRLERLRARGQTEASNAFGPSRSKRPARKKVKAALATKSDQSGNFLVETGWPAPKHVRQWRKPS